MPRDAFRLGPCENAEQRRGKGIVTAKQVLFHLYSLQYGKRLYAGSNMDSASGPQNSVSQKNQEVVDLYDNYVAGGFAPYPVCLH